MTKQEFRDIVKTKYLILDGATGSNLQKAGMPTGVCPEEWVLEHPDALIDLQRQFVASGTNIVYAPTFTGNRIKLAEYDLQDRLYEINTELVKLSKRAVGDKAFVAGDLTMTGRQLSPMGDLDFEELVEVYKEQIRALEEGGADLLVVETMMSLQETRAALIAAKETTGLPVMATLTFEADGRTLFGSDPETAMIVLQALGADAVGANCSTGPDQMSAVIAAMKKVAKVPVIAKPNAGLPKLGEDGKTVYDMDAEQFADQAGLLLEAGATILGGCCGTTPEHIAGLTRAVREYEQEHPVCLEAEEKVSLRYLTSERQTLAFGLNGRFMIVGERINPTGKKKLQEEIRQGDFSRVELFVEQQEERGASVLDVNMGMSGVDEKVTLLKVMEQVTQLTSLPLCIDSTSPAVMEAVLRRYPGRALINSVSFEKDRMENMLPLAKKYGAMFILLPVSDEGLPKDLKEKKEIVQKIMDQAFALGLTKEDIVVDGLVGTVGANPRAALETLETISWCRQQDLATICGLSNISFGLPERGYVNSSFLTMAIHEGLTMAIANPNQELLTAAMFASDLLLSKEGADIAYIEEMNRRKEVAAETAADLSEGKADKASGGSGDAFGGGLTSEQVDLLEKVRTGVMKGNKAKIAEMTKTAHEAGVVPRRILDNVLLPAINAVGDLFDQGRYFLPQLIASAESMKLAIEYLEPFLMEGNAGKSKGTIVIATVEGDIHDIGKNLVALMLKNYGFRVLDLGKDVPKETIIETALKEKADIIGLSALMTTTMQQMEEVVKYAAAQGCKARIMIGGAVITPDYADQIGADAYSKDAADAVKMAEQLLLKYIDA